MADFAVDVKKQLTFYGAYHSQKANVAIHIVCVPLILWSALCMGHTLPTPEWFPQIHYVFNKHLAFDFNWPFLWALANELYYILLEPVAGLLYAPQMALMFCHSQAFARQPGSYKTALYLHIFSWIMQFIGHGVFEGRAPALKDNLLGALVTAPYFVHLELLFSLGYNRPLHRSIQNEVGKEIASFRRGQAEEKRKSS